MTALNLGVIDLPYSKESKTTGDVAEILEGKYHLFTHFFEMYEAQITTLLSDALAGSLESALTGAPAVDDPYASGTQEIGALFRKFLVEREMDSPGYPGIPTAAAMAGVNHRLAHPYAKSNPERPSFVDTGLLISSFLSWADK